MKKYLISIAVLAIMFVGVAPMSSACERTVTIECGLAASTNWDKVLDEFDKYVTQYEKTYKKVKQGDDSAAVEMLKLAERTQALSAKLENAEDEMTPAQMERYLKILGRFAKIVSME